MPSKREKELEAIIMKLMPAMRDIAWCALVWNDHNFSVDDLLQRTKRAAKSLGFERHDGVEPFNEWWAQVDRVLRGSDNGTE